MLSIWFPWSEVVSSFSVVQMHVWFHEASFWLRGAPQLCFGLIVNNAAGHRFSHLSTSTCKIPNEKSTLKSQRTIRVNFSLSNSMRIDATEVGLIVPLAWFLFTTSFLLFFFTTKDLSFKVSLRTLHPTTAFGVQTWQLTFHSQDPGSNAVVSLPTFREQSSMFWTWWNWCEMVKLVKSESGETSWSDLHVRRSLQHDHQKWNKLVNMLDIQEKLSQKLSIKSS